MVRHHRSMGDDEEVDLLQKLQMLAADADESCSSVALLDLPGGQTGLLFGYAT